MRELRELGPGAAAFRIAWELKTRSGVLTAVDWAGRGSGHGGTPSADYLHGLPFAPAQAVVDAIGPLLGKEDRDRLSWLASEASEGRILAFGRWFADYGNPPNWHRSPVSKRGWSASQHWTRAIRSGLPDEDIKLVWEIGRFPHAYHLTRAAAFDPNRATHFAVAFQTQVRSFVDQNPTAHGVHWASGQEIAFRLIAWLFATQGLLSAPQFEDTRAMIGTAAVEASDHILRHIDYARKAVHNNHILSEALALYAVGGVFREHPRSAIFKSRGRALLDEHVPRQFYADGGYIQQSHNYQRLALQVLVTASVMASSFGESPSTSWLEAVDRSLTFLVAQQNPTDGRLPNYGANDGGLPLVLSTCDFADFRPTLQAGSLLCRGSRLYPPGPWDEESCWFLGPDSLGAPHRPIALRSASFPVSGFHVQRGEDKSTYSVLRCGTVLDRFSQIDMLHLDVWWRGINVLVDAGSYLYNGPTKWHNHFVRTESHNTVVVDGRDQMLHFRPFKCLYRTGANLLALQDARNWSVRAGEHYGYQRYAGKVKHRRAVLFVKDDCWVVVDTLLGEGQHRARVHWLAAAFPVRPAERGCLALRTPGGAFSLAVFDEIGRPLQGDVVAAHADPPRGWLSRYYGEKEPALSLVVQRSGALPMAFITVLSAGAPRVGFEHPGWTIESDTTVTRFRVRQGLVTDVTVAPKGSL